MDALVLGPAVIGGPLYRPPCPDHYTLLIDALRPAPGHGDGPTAYEAQPPTGEG